MAMIETARPAPFGAITTYRATNMISGLYAAVKSTINVRSAARQTADELARLTPAQLADIGLSDADVVNMRARAGLI